MTFNTKYNIGDFLWFIADNKILNLPVEKIGIDYEPFFFSNDKLRIKYTFFEKIEEYKMFPEWNKNKVYIKNENEVYKTKEELCKNL